MAWRNAFLISIVYSKVVFIQTTNLAVGYVLDSNSCNLGL
jgi:hypothetical protein